MARVIVAYGTRPERIKLQPVIDALTARGVAVYPFASGQSADLVGGSATTLPTWWKQGLWRGMSETGSQLTTILKDDPEGPFDAVIVQGDTATAFACAQAAFLAQVPVAHVEAGMRTYSSEPWPEEAFRRQIAAVAKWHFCPSNVEAHNIRIECTDDATFGRVYVTGNTVIDTLPKMTFRVLVTLHRRENWGARIASALAELEHFAAGHDNIIITAIQHPNWHAQGINIANYPSLRFREPLGHAMLLEYLHGSDAVVTDSGGLQEESAHFGVPCIVFRTSTERVALERSGAVELVDPDDAAQVRFALERQLQRRRAYGTGDASTKIADILARELRSDA